MNKIMDMLKKVDKKTVVGIAGGLLTIGSLIINKQNETIAKHEAAEEAAKIVMDKLNGKEG